MKSTEKVMEILNDLIRINNDRVEGYQKAEKEVKDTASTEVKALFFQMIEESRSFAYELSDVVLRLGGVPEEDTTTSGKIYRLWMDIRSTFSGGSVRTVLESCEFGEDAAVKTYKEAMEEENLSWPEDVFQIISRQRQAIQASHNRIKHIRDYFKTADVR
jgi:uncharacterized protein (TIGR02284 family)